MISGKLATRMAARRIATARPAMLSLCGRYPSLVRAQLFSSSRQTRSKSESDHDNDDASKPDDKPVEKIKRRQREKPAVKLAKSSNEPNETNESEKTDKTDKPADKKTDPEPANQTSTPSNSSSSSGPTRRSLKPQPGQILFADSNAGDLGGPGSGSAQWHSNNGKKRLIPSDKHVLPIVLSHRPVFPGLAVHCNSTDEKLIMAVDALDRVKSWDRTVVAFLQKNPGGSTTHLMTDPDEVYPVGCICRMETIEITNSQGRTVFNSSLFPLYRVTLGELTKPDADLPIVREHDTGLDVTSYDTSQPPSTDPQAVVNVHWMKNISALAEEPYALNDRSIQELCFKIIDILFAISNLSYPLKVQVEKFSKLVRRSPGEDFQKPEFLADFCAALCSGDKEIQEILEITDVKKRLEAALELLNREITSIKMQEKFSKVIQEQTAQRQREFILQEQYKYAKRELGLDDDKSKLADKFLDRANALVMPEEVRKAFDEELTKFRGLEPSAGEYSTVKSYLDWLVSLPWGVYSVDKFDLRQARRILDEHHYGLNDVKDRILEFIAVGKLSGNVDGKIVCLAGPPGVGKTSVARSVAEALNRKFDRFSVGGLYDASQIKGHRRTYVAAMPGRIVQSLKKCQTQNPVILIDEIDKVSTSGAHGDPAAALLEVLDPEQNKNFQDTYLEVPVDISKVLFMCTANVLENLPQPLKDRMEIIHIPGYVQSEKVSIAENYLAPKLLQKTGLEHADVALTRETIDRLVSHYTRESGVRGLNKVLEKIYRKIAYNLVVEEEDRVVESGEAAEATVEATETSTVKTESVESETSETTATESTAETSTSEGTTETVETPAKPLIDPERLKDFHLEVTPKDLAKYVGAPQYTAPRLYEKFPPGVTMGLAYTPLGGVPLFVETVLQQPLEPKLTPKLTRTGHLGDVMNESSSIAYSFSRMFMVKRFPGNRFLDRAVIHTHFPEGAVKKDGPSAGIAMATSLVSLALNKSVNSDVCMTGEITLTGKVLQIGGLREKAAAAKAAGSKIIVFPKDNTAEWEDLPELIREGLEPRPVSWYDEVFDVAFGAVDQHEIENMWVRELGEPVHPQPLHGDAPISQPIGQAPRSNFISAAFQ